MDDITIRWMLRKDIPQVEAIENSVFEFPWRHDEFPRCLIRRNCIGMVAQRRDWVMGYMIYSLHKSRLNILNFAVHPLTRYCGIGRMMCEKLKGKLSQQRRTRIIADIRDSNVDAQLFFAAMGFKAAGVMPSYYDETPDDAYRFRYDLNSVVEAEATKEVGP